jgi:DUF1680 family protein
MSLEMVISLEYQTENKSGKIAEGNINANSFGLNNRWVPLYNIHKTYAGLRDAYYYTKSEKAKKMLIKLTDWMSNEVSGLSDDKFRKC